MSKRVHDIFVVVVNFISNDWRAKHVSTIGLFEVIHTSGIAMVLKLQELLYRFVLTLKKLLIKDERSNLQTCANALNYVVSYNSLGLLKPFDGSCFEHEFSKVCKYAIRNDKLCTSLSYASIKDMKVPSKNALDGPKNQAKVGKPRIKLAYILN
jgi:hypothetical protein